MSLRRGWLVQPREDFTQQQIGNAAEGQPLRLGTNCRRTSPSRNSKVHVLRCGAVRDADEVDPVRPEDVAQHGDAVVRAVDLLPVLRKPTPFQARRHFVGTAVPVPAPGSPDDESKRDRRTEHSR